MDMWEAYYNATIKNVPEARNKIVHDKFHIMKHVNEAVDKVRRQEHRELMSRNDETLKGSKYLWLYRNENVPDKHRPTLESLKKANLKVSRAWAMKESLPDVWNYRYEGWARKFLNKWIIWTKKSCLPPMKKVGELIERHIDNIVTYCTHKISNGVAEGLNSKIMTIKRKACGYPNRDHFITAIYFFCGGLDLYPRHVDSVTPR